jgi:hypothetical protein
MGNHLKGCHLPSCRRGLRCKFGKALLKKISRSFRRQTKRAVGQGKEPPHALSVPHTDY